ncbi:unnamed protein product [Linum trigynum]|uniref:CCT domain-containing protein n=1 Tax=Linum trigynum TaxID=586398 RepID=A0AAV2CQ73_9ROSI
MSSPCLSGGGGRAYGGFDLEIVKSTSSRTSQTTSSSPSSTLSESSNSPLAISTRKPRTPRKRPNQTYNEAAALLSTAYPKIFPAAAVPTSKPFSPLPLDSSELLFFPIREKSKDPKSAATTEVSSRDNSCQSSSVADWKELCGGGGGGYDEEEFDAESILDEEIEEGGIDSIMGNLSVVSSSSVGESVNQSQIPGFVYGYPPGFSSRNFHQWVGNGAPASRNRGGIRAFRRVDDWWSYPVVDVLQISPRLNSTNRRSSSSFDVLPGGAESNGKATVKQSLPGSGEKKKSSNSSSKKKKKVEKLEENESKAAILREEEEKSKAGKSGLLLNLNYDEVLKAWSGKGSPFPEDLDGNDVSTRVAQIDLFSLDGGVNDGIREASVLRYKEKRRSRLFFKKIRYQVRKVNADQRPRMKGRFVRRSNSIRSERSSSPSSSSQNDDEL